MMSAGAFNALLKTLEEPPEQVIFILATTEPYKVLPTILSRCQRFDFGKIDDQDIREKLIWILDKEKVTYDEKGIDAIVSLADGGMRDALSILDQVLAYSGSSFGERDVLALFGLTSNVQKIELLKQIRAGNVAGVLAKLEEFLASGVDIKRLSDNLMEILKDLVIYEKTHEETLLTSINEKEALELEPLIDAAYANQMIQILIKTQIDFKSVSNIRSLFELTLLQLCTLNSEPAVNPNVVMKEAAAMPEPKKAQPKTAPAPEKAIEAPAAVTKSEPVKPAAPEVTVTAENDSTPPSFLFEEEKKPAPAKPAPAPVVSQTPAAPAPAVLDISGVKNPTIVTEGEAYTLSIDTLVNIMTVEAVNSLLKFLEEPTPGTYAILTSQNEAKVLPTIISRCESMRLLLLPREEVVKDALDLGTAPEDADILANFYNDGQMIKDEAASEDYQNAKSAFVDELDALNQNASMARYVMEKDVTPLLNDKPSARFYFDMLSLAFQDIVAAKNGQPIKLASYANIIKDLAKKLPHVESSLLAIMTSEPAVLPAV